VLGVAGADRRSVHIHDRAIDRHELNLIWIISKCMYIMSLLESKINSIAAIAVDAALNSARLDYVNQTFYSKSDAVSALSSKQQNIILSPCYDNPRSVCRLYLLR
jgi:hypothetical protein